MKAKFLVAAGVVGLSGMVAALADDVQFVTLPETVRTAVIRETRIPDVSRVTRVVRDENGLYEVTVRRESDNDVVFVDPYGRVVKRLGLDDIGILDSALPAALPPTLYSRLGDAVFLALLLICLIPALGNTLLRGRNYSN